MIKNLNYETNKVLQTTCWEAGHDMVNASISINVLNTETGMSVNPYVDLSNYDIQNALMTLIEYYRPYAGHSVWGDQPNYSISLIIDCDNPALLF